MSKSLKGQGKVAFGIFVDGLELKLAHLSLKGTRILIHDLKKVTLLKKLDEQITQQRGFDETQEIFSASDQGESHLLQPEKTDSNAEIILSLLSQYPSTKYRIAYSLAEPSVYYHTLEGSAGSKNAHLKKRALEELKNIRSGSPDPDSMAVIPSSEKGMLCVVREDGLHLINLLEEIKPYIGKRLPRIPFIDTADFALMNLVRLDYSLREEEISVIIYVGVEFSRIIFMKGEKHLHFAPLITEGTESPHLDNRLYSRILLEQDNLDVPELHRIVLAGNAQKIHLKDFLRTRFPSVEVEYLKLKGVERTDTLLQTDELCSEYAIPIATAWRALDLKNKAFSPVNLLPVSLIERQKFFKLAWHGYALLVLLFFATLFFTWNILKTGLHIRQKTSVLIEKEHRLADNINMKNTIAALQTKIDRHKNAIALYDSLVPGSDQWSKIFTKGTKKIEELGSLWLTNITSTVDGGMEITGIALYRNRIPRFAALYERGMLRRVSVKQIRDVKVYEFNLYVPDIGRR